MNDPTNSTDPDADVIEAEVAEPEHTTGSGDQHSAIGGAERRAIFGVPVEVVVCVGRATPPIGDLIAMRRDAVIMLDRRIDDPVDIRIGDRIIARGELQELEDGSGRLGVRMTEIVDGPGSL